MKLILAAALALTFLPDPLLAADPAPPSAAELASSLSAMQQDSTYVRLRMEIKTGGGSTVLQVQIKERHTKNSTDLVYQILFPKERKGESVLLRKSSRGFSGAVFTPPDGIKTLDSSRLKDPLFGGDLTYEDLVDDFFSWDQQAIVGEESINRTPCHVLESKPGKGEHGSYASVRSWIDAKRNVPLRIEKYGASGQLLRRIETTDVVKDGSRHIPAKLIVQGGRRDSLTDLDGSKIKHGANYTDEDFSPEGLKKIAVPSTSD